MQNTLNVIYVGLCEMLLGDFYIWQRGVGANNLMCVKNVQHIVVKCDVWYTEEGAYRHEHCLDITNNADETNTIDDADANETS